MGRIYIILIILSVVGSATFAAYKYYQNMQQQIIQLAEENAVLDTALTTTRETLQLAEANAERQAELANQLQNRLNDAEEKIGELRRVLTDHDLTELSLRRPGLIEGRINDATQDVFNQLELDTGRIDP